MTTAIFGRHTTVRVGQSSAMIEAQFVQEEAFAMDTAGLILGVLGVALAVYFYLKSRRFKRLSFEVRAFPLFHDSATALPDLVVSYRGQRVQNLTAVTLLVENTGTEVISALDVSEKDPLQVIVPEPDARVLSGRVIFLERTAHDVRFRPLNVSAAPVQFDYLAPGEGFVLALLHTASDATPIKLAGTIKGGAITNAEPPKSRSMAWRWPAMLAAIVLLVPPAVAWFADFSFLPKDMFRPYLVAAVVTAALVQAIVLGRVLLWRPSPRRGALLYFSARHF